MLNKGEQLIIFCNIEQHYVWKERICSNLTCLYQDNHWCFLKSFAMMTSLQCVFFIAQYCITGFVTLNKCLGGPAILTKYLCIFFTQPSIWPKGQKVRDTLERWHRANTERQTITRTRIHSYSNMHVFGLWEVAQVTRESPRRKAQAATQGRSRSILLHCILYQIIISGRQVVLAFRHVWVCVFVVYTSSQPSYLSKHGCAFFFSCTHLCLLAMYHYNTSNCWNKLKLFHKDPCDCQPAFKLLPSFSKEFIPNHLNQA